MIPKATRMQGTLHGQRPQVANRLPGGVPREAAVGIGGRQPGHGQTTQPAKHRHAHKHPRRQPPALHALVAGDDREPTANAHPDHRRRHRRQAEQPVGRRNVLRRQHLGNAAQLCGSKQGTQSTHQRHDHHECREILGQNGRPGQYRDEDFGELAGHDDRAAAKTVRQIPGRCRQEEIGQDKARGPGHQNHADVFFRDKILADADDEPANNVVVGGAEQLREQQADEAGRQQTAPRRFERVIGRRRNSRFPARVSGCTHRDSMTCRPGKRICWPGLWH